MSNGTLQLEWHDGPKSLELEFESPVSIRFLQWDSRDKLENEDSFSPKDIPRAIELIGWFMAKEDR